MNSASTIDLMKTSNGYSIYENDTLVNKPSVTTVAQPNPTTTKNPKPQRQSAVAASKKTIIQHQNFTIYPYIYSKENQQHRYVIVPARSQWFNLNSIHEIERKELPQWFRQKKGLMATMSQIKFQKNQELYKKYRNYIIDLAKTQYVSPTMARKGLAGDACAIMRIHNFLQKWGLINFVHKKPIKSHEQSQSLALDNLNSFYTSSQKSIRRKKDGFDKYRSLLSKIYDKDDIQLLKKITRKFRPVCDFCDSLCGILWYEYTQKLIIKNFNFSEQQPTVRVVTSGEPFYYHVKVCLSCFCEKNFPIVLCYDDFVKKSLISSINEVDFDQKYGKKKTMQLARFADTLEKNKFNLSKSSQQLKISEQELMEIFLSMPVQYLQKMSRVQPQTEDEIQKLPSQLQVQKIDEKVTKSNTDNVKESVIIDDQQMRTLRNHVENFEREQKQIYGQFLQAWLLKMYVKLEELQKWDKSIQWRIQQNQSNKKHQMAEKIKDLWAKCEQ